MERELDAAYEGLFMAAEHGRADVVKALLEHGKDVLDIPQIRNALGLTPLHVAVIHQKADAVRTLLAAGFPPDAAVLPTNSKYSGMTAYQLAVNQAPVRTMVQVFLQYTIQQIAMNHVESVEALLRAGIDPVTATDGPPHENSLLHWAACSNAVEVVNLLLDRYDEDDTQRTVLMNRRNADGATALHDACHANHVQVVQALVERGADLTIVANAGYGKDKTPVEVATSKEITRIIAKGKLAIKRSMPPTREEIVQTDEEAPMAVALPPLSNSTYGPLSHTKSNDPSIIIEEKQALIDELKQTIDDLVTDAHDRSLLGEEQVVLEFIRKLREEKQMVERHLHDAEEHIVVQEELMIELKAQIRHHNSIVEELRREIDSLKKAPVQECTKSSVADMPQISTQPDDASITTLLDVTGAPSTTPKSTSFWSSLFYFLWPFADEETLPFDSANRDEPIMTV
ncbi:hypothetical protein Ae201684P_014793 [Aphanomyces euteiches]|uniref:Uncharacterized protein n=1 Tax=Aphanomyces euteiches TaxID=100861 RepID=A0A6G0WXN4_9STRA|nr:hypothetical protein Ae201684_010555 [Aphanomyces euteiches]KAH9090038.1 hypothetical protein Ae201684P_014793 [Aphanomyces euteiches]KAH9145376.1 hypothetical protein AeRB84_010729 [Aphanomyces euteiches]